MSKNTLRVYDTIAKKYVEVEVSENVRVGYNRSQWNIDDNDKSFYQHEISSQPLSEALTEHLRTFTNL